MTDLQSEPSPPAPTGPGRAVAIGHLTITLPMLAILALVFVSARALGLRSSSAWILGAGVGWGYWWMRMPRWRAWVVRSGADPAAVQRLAVFTLLAWPGRAFERE